MRHDVRTARLRQLISERCLAMPGAFNAMTARLIEAAGFEVEALYGGFEREPFDRSANEFVWIVRKPV